MFLGGNFLGYSLLVQASVIPAPTTYNKVEVFGDCVVDKVIGFADTLSDAELNSWGLNKLFEWTPNIIFYAEFSNSLQAGNISGLGTSVETWVIYRKNIISGVTTEFTKVAEIPATQTLYNDHMVKNHKDYQYQIYAKTSTALSTPLISLPTYTDFRYWSLVNYNNPDKVWNFYLDLQTDSMNVNNPIMIYDQVYSTFPSVSFSNRNYITGSIKFTAGEIVDETFEYSVNYLDDLREFITNGQPKILKNKIGQAWKVATYDMNWNFNDSIKEQIATVSFSFVQIGEINT